MIHYVKGNLLDSDCDYICHQVNCQGVMNSGIAKQIRERWPEVYWSYEDAYKNHLKYNEPLLGRIDEAMITCSTQSVINMFAQRDYGYDGMRYTSYDAFIDCLNEIKMVVPKGYTIGFPKNIGCCRGGANWNVISTMITEVLGKDFEVYIYELEGA